MAPEGNFDVAISGNWQARARLALAASGNAIADILAPGCSVKSIDADLVKASPTHLSLRARIGTRTALLKVFDGAGSVGARPYKTERDVLARMKQTGLVPRLRAYCDAERWVLVDGIPQPAVGPSEQLDVQDFAYKVGVWIARFEATAPYEAAAGNWSGYFQKLGLGAYIAQIGNAKEMLTQIPLCGRVLARNDAALHNYILCPDGQLLGCDFESVRLKPRGWEYLITWQALLQRFGDDADNAIAAFSDGFNKEHRGCLITDELNAIARILFCAQFLQAQDQRARAA